MSKRIKKTNKYTNIIKAIIVFAIYFMWPYFVTTILNTLNLSGNLGLSIRLVLNFVLLAVIVFLYKDDLAKEYKDFRKNRKKNLLSGLGILVIGYVMYGLSSLLIYAINPSIEDVNDIGITAIFNSAPILLFINTMFFYPIVEELVFKKSFKDIITNKWLFVIITGILNSFFQYALISYNDYLAFVYIIPNCFFAMAFSYMYYKTDNIFTSITYRMLYNLIPNIGNILFGILLLNI